MISRTSRPAPGAAFRAAVLVIKPMLLIATRREWVGGERLPRTGGCVVAMNHLSKLDPITAGHLMWDHGRTPRYLAKSSLFANPALGAFLRAAGQIPVERERVGDAVGGASAYRAAVQAVRAGECLVVYPEGTITRDPDQWPMRGKSGAARIALETGCPVIPVGQWGAQQLLPAYARRPDLRHRATIAMRVGEPVDLDDLRATHASGEFDAEAVREATSRIIAAITAELAVIRDRPGPQRPFDPREHGLPEYGDPRRTGPPHQPPKQPPHPVQPAQPHQEDQ